MGVRNRLHCSAVTLRSAAEPKVWVTPLFRSGSQNFLATDRRIWQGLDPLPSFLRSGTQDAWGF